MLRRSFSRLLHKGSSIQYDPAILRYEPRYPVVTYGAADTLSGIVMQDTAYLPPVGAVYVATTGNDTTGDGSSGTPYATITKALTVVASGGTIVVRGGSYPESFDTTKACTIQAYPHELVYFLGYDTIATGSWTATGSQWSASGITNLRWTNTSRTIGERSGYQVWYDGVRLVEIFSAATDVIPGTFYVNTSTNVLYIGSNPSGHTVNVTMRRRCRFHDTGTVKVWGIGFIGYGAQIQDGALKIENCVNVDLRDCVAAYNAGAGYSITGQKSQRTLVYGKHNTSVRNGYMGFHSSYWDAGSRWVDDALGYNNRMHAMLPFQTTSSDLASGRIAILNAATATATGVALTIGGVACTGDTTNGSRILKNVTNLSSNVQAGQTITGTGIPASTTVEYIETGYKVATGFEAGGCKISLSHDVLVGGGHVHDNSGGGRWSDQWCRGNVFIFDLIHGHNQPTLTNHGSMHELSTACYRISNAIRDSKYNLKHNESNHSEDWNNTAGSASGTNYEILETAPGLKRRYPAIAVAMMVNGNTTITLDELYGMTTYASDNDNGTLYGPNLPITGAQIQGVSAASGAGTVTVRVADAPTAGGIFPVHNGDYHGDADGQVAKIRAKNNLFINDVSGALNFNANDNATNVAKRAAMEFFDFNAGLNGNWYYNAPGLSSSHMRFIKVDHTAFNGNLTQFKTHVEAARFNYEIDGVEDHVSSSCVWVTDQSTPTGYRAAGAARFAGKTIPRKVAQKIAMMIPQMPSNVDILNPHVGCIHNDYTIYAQDRFGRTTASGWGTAEVGGAWTASGTAAKFSTVPQGLAKVLWDSSATYRQTLAAAVQDIEILAYASVDGMPVTGRVGVSLVGRYIDGNNGYRVEMQFNVDGSLTIQGQKAIAGTTTAYGSAANTSFTTANPWTPGQNIWCRVRFVGINPTKLYAKAWAWGSDEPMAWQINGQSDSSAAMQTTGGVGLRVGVSGTAPTNFPFNVIFGEFLALTPGG